MQYLYLLGIFGVLCQGVFGQEDGGEANIDIDVEWFNCASTDELKPTDLILNSQKLELCGVARRKNVENGKFSIVADESLLVSNLNSISQGDECEAIGEFEFKLQMDFSKNKNKQAKVVFTYTIKPSKNQLPNLLQLM